MIPSLITDLAVHYKKYREILGSKISLIFVLSVMSALLEALGIFLILPLLNSIGLGGKRDSFNDHWLDLAVGEIFNGFAIETLILLIVTAFALKGLVAFSTYFYISKLKAQFSVHLKTGLLDMYQALTLSEYSKTGPGEIVNVINGQADKLLRSFHFFSQLIVQIVSSSILISAAFFVAWDFGAMIVISGILIFTLFRRLSLYVNKISREFVSTNIRLEAELIQLFLGFKYLISTNRMKNASGETRVEIKKVAELERKLAVASGFTLSSREPVMVVLVGAVVFFQIAVLDQQIEPIITALIFFQRGLNQLFSVQTTWQNSLETAGALEKIDSEFASHTVEDVSKPGVTASGLNENFDMESINLIDVEYKYPDSQTNALNGINLTIEAKQVTAIIGQSGSGKTTLADLLTKMFDPTHGVIYIGSRDLSSVSVDGWRRNIGYLTQDPVLFDGSIQENLFLGSDTSELDELPDIPVEVLEKANVLEFIERLPNGIKENVGDRGTNLSGGQRQRVALARELLRNPALLILDEATSALDVYAERSFRKTVEKLKGSITTVVIAHRLASVQNADKIIILDQGRVVESGSFKELAAKEGSLLAKFISEQEDS